MKNVQIKNFHIPTFLLESLQLENEINETEKLLAHLNAKMTRLEEESKILVLIMEAIKQFQVIVPIAYPQVENNRVVKQMIADLHMANFTSIKDLMELMRGILFRIFFSEGEDKVFAKTDPAYFDWKKYKAITRNGIFIPRKWMQQLVICLNAKDANQDMILHNITPEWLWPCSFRMMIELYKLTGEAIKTNANGKDTIR